MTSANDGNGGAGDVFVRDLKKGKTRMVSISSGGVAGGIAEDSLGTAMSPNGRYVVFNSEVDDLAPGDGDTDVDVFIRNRRTGNDEAGQSRATTATNGDDVSGERGWGRLRHDRRSQRTDGSSMFELVRRKIWWDGE